MATGCGCVYHILCYKVTPSPSHPETFTHRSFASCSQKSLVPISLSLPSQVLVSVASALYPLPYSACPPSSVPWDAWCNECFWTKDNPDLLHDTELIIMFTASKHYWGSKFLLSSLTIFDRNCIRIHTEKTYPDLQQRRDVTHQNIKAHRIYCYRET